MQPAGRSKREFGIEQSALGKKHVHVARNASLVAQVGHMQCRAQGLDLLLLRLALRIKGTNSHESVLNLLERNQDGLLVLRQYLPCLGLYRPLVESQALCVQQWTRQTKPAHPELTAGEQQF